MWVHAQKPVRVCRGTALILQATKELRNFDAGLHEYFRYLFSFAVAAMAQCLMYLNSLDKAKPFLWWEFFGAVALSGFIGFLICMAAHSYGLPDEAAGALAGLGGMMGKDGVSILKSFLERGGR